jgi:hypothetical protein
LYAFTAEPPPNIVRANWLAARRDGHNDRIMVGASHLTAVEAADTLNVGVETVIALFGSSDRIPASDVAQFRAELVVRRRTALDAMLTDAGTLGLYD